MYTFYQKKRGALIRLSIQAREKVAIEKNEECDFLQLSPIPTIRFNLPSLHTF